jgi:F420-dependent oxidoreductase-like protein
VSPLRVCLVVEGQEGVGWEETLAFARACERGGLDGVFRSDHYAGDPERGSLDAWTTLAALAMATERVRLGTLVSPVTFRHPSVLAKVVTTVDHISHGRVDLGVGVGWFAEEHRTYGFAFPDLATRAELLDEQLEIVHRQWTESEFDFDGRHYRLERCLALPKPFQRPHPPLIVGGRATPATLRPAVRFADEYNTFYATTAAVRARRSRAHEACERAGRDPSSLAFSVMTMCVLGERRADVLARIAAALPPDSDPEGRLAAKREIWVVGTPEDAVERLVELEEIGVDRVLLQVLDHSDLDLVELLASEVLPALRASGSRR